MIEKYKVQLDPNDQQHYFHDKDRHHSTKGGQQIDDSTLPPGKGSNSTQNQQPKSIQGKD